MEEQKKKFRLSAFDAVLIVLLAACLVAAGFGYYFKRTSADATVAEADKEEYAVMFECYDVAQFHAQLLKEGEVYMLPDNSEFGTLSEKVTTTPALTYTQRSDGTYVRTYAPENGDQTRVDVSGVVRTKGARNSRGFLLIGNAFEAIPGSSFIIHNSTVSIRVTITAVEKVSK